MSARAMSRSCFRTLGSACLLASLTALTACVSPGPTGGDKDAIYEQARAELVLDEGETGDLDLVASPTEVRGTFLHEDVRVRFETRVLRHSIETEITLRGMTLLSTVDRETGVFDVDGFASESGLDTQMTDEDRALLVALEAALSEEYEESGKDLPALDFLNRALTVWGGYSTTLPLQRVFYGRLDQSASLCGNVNRKGAWGIWTAGTHDCNSGAGDCSDWWGCDRWNDNSTTDYVFMSMHPAGGCADTTFFGENAGAFSCYEPSHPGNTEYGYGDCFGRCGAGCGSSTVFTADCLDHDQCVRLGHDMASFWCNDEFTGAAWDATWGSNCSGVTFTVAYNWAGTGYQGACPTSWNNTNDGCDHGCQFIDADCAR